MHIDLPTRADVERLAAARDPLSVTLYVPTTPVTPDADHNRLQLRNLADVALAQLRERTDKRTFWQLEEHIDELVQDEQFWLDVGHSLAVFVTLDGIVEFRLPSKLEPYVGVGDRFAITPLLRALTFPHAALALAISQNGSRLIEVSADLPPVEVEVPGAPRNAESIVGLRSIGGRSHYGRLAGGEGRKVRLTQYARALDHALRPVLNGESLPLVLVATEPLLSIYRNLTGYANVAGAAVRGNADESTDQQIAEEVREILDALYAEELVQLRALYAERKNAGRASTDLSDLAKAAAWGNLDTLAVDMNAHVAGTVEDDGTLTLGDESGHDVLEEIARRALATGARVLAVRAEDLPDGIEAAGILRYAPVV